MTTDEGGSPGNGENDGAADDAGESANTRKISETQVGYILENFPDAAAYPPGRLMTPIRTPLSSSTAALAC